MTSRRMRWEGHVSYLASWRLEMLTKLVKRPEERGQLGYLGVYRRSILKWILNK
jgi:hypothetical protein